MLILAALLSAAIHAPLAADSVDMLGRMETPTVSHTPVVHVKGLMVADSIVIEKAKHLMTLYEWNEPVHHYYVALGAQPKGDKVKKGDNRTPEGVFHIDYKNPQSRYHLALHLSYPDSAHLARARKLGVEPGGDIMIHGLPKAFESYGASHRDTDWTEGCVAVTDEEIEQIWRAVPAGTTVQIKP